MCANAQHITPSRVICVICVICKDVAGDHRKGLRPTRCEERVSKKPIKLVDVGLSMMCYTFGKEKRMCLGDCQLSGLMGKLL